MANFCSNCGKEVNEGAGFCSVCGTQTGRVQAQPQYQRPQHQAGYTQAIDPRLLLKTLEGKLNLTGVFWIVSAVICALGAIGLFLWIDLPWWLHRYYWAELLTDLEFMLLFLPTIFLAVGTVVNLMLGLSKLKLKKAIKGSPTGIISKYENVGGKVGVLIYSIFFGGIFGIVAAIIDLVTRSFVMKNYQQFMDLENAHK